MNLPLAAVKRHVLNTNDKLPPGLGTEVVSPSELRVVIVLHADNADTSSHVYRLRIVTRMFNVCGACIPITHVCVQVSLVHTADTSAGDAVSTNARLDVDAASASANFTARALSCSGADAGALPFLSVADDLFRAHAAVVQFDTDVLTTPTVGHPDPVHIIAPNTRTITITPPPKHFPENTVARRKAKSKPLRVLLSAFGHHHSQTQLLYRTVFACIPRRSHTRKTKRLQCNTICAAGDACICGHVRTHAGPIGPTSKSSQHNTQG